jgi:hypothetical protein
MLFGDADQVNVRPPKLYRQIGAGHANCYGLECSASNATCTLNDALWFLRFDISALLMPGDQQIDRSSLPSLSDFRRLAQQSGHLVRR